MLMARLGGFLEHWNRELKSIDERLEMAWFDETVNHPAVVPCRYHILRHNEPPAPMSVIPVVDSEGNFVEPDSGIFEMLLKGDMWSEAAQRERKRAIKLAEAAKDRERERETEDRRQEIIERIQANTRTFVSMSRDSAWSQNAAGRRGARR
jgi:hypothetical protein